MASAVATSVARRNYAICNIPVQALRVHIGRVVLTTIDPDQLALVTGGDLPVPISTTPGVPPPNYMPPIMPTYAARQDYRAQMNSWIGTFSPTIPTPPMPVTEAQMIPSSAPVFSPLPIPTAI